MNSHEIAELTTKAIEDPARAPDVSPQLYLLDCSEPEEKIKASWPRF